METTTQHRNSLETARYTVGLKTYKTAERVKMREVKIYRNGAWIYCDAFTEAERETHEAWAKEFLEAMKRNDTRQHQVQPEQEKEPEEMPVQAVQQLIWENILKLREAGLMTNREAANLCLVRFTWSESEAKAKLTELKERYTNRK
ncbi:hypothetical protein CLV24_105155 [Pontibacter ummariensis]|uniref:Uncharacterized protein n=1 Tax=Pontibacter ummariensis TaxID=1610492 RepID=A0A239DTU1_9BACT|nr:hypothetical protein [Pontibacter ummariensis]PRY13785.1 hypothetical protein CLV24_105155 [Pontibacter ummariensis]SNS35153.1 hypothetical protein SAMN06296052_10597 [Pontibacter ummariensis]